MIEANKIKNIQKKVASLGEEVKKGHKKINDVKLKEAKKIPVHVAPKLLPKETKVSIV